jgi:hypothetical protein
MGRLGDFWSAGCSGMCSLERMCLCSQGVRVRLMNGPGHLDIKHTGQVGVKITPCVTCMCFTKIALVRPGQAWGD